MKPPLMSQLWSFSDLNPTASVVPYLWRKWKRKKELIQETFCPHPSLRLPTDKPVTYFYVLLLCMTERKHKLEWVSGNHLNLNTWKIRYINFFLIYERYVYQNPNSYVPGHIFYDKMYCPPRIHFSLSKDEPRLKILNIKDKF